jgi:membrane protein
MGSVLPHPVFARLSAWRVLVAASWRTFSARGGRLLSAAIAYYALLSLAPGFVIAVQVAAVFTDEALARAVLLRHIARWVGPAGASTVGELLLRAEEAGAGASVVGALVLAYGATRLFANLTRALDILWGVEPEGDRALHERALGVLRRRLLAFGLVAGIGLVLAALIGAQVVLAAARETTGLGHGVLEHVFESVASFGLTIGLFTTIFGVLPTARVPWRDALVGGFWTAALFTVGSLLVSAYVGRKAGDSTFGAATSVVLLLLWLHYAAHAFFFGAALTATRAAARAAAQEAAETEAAETQAAQTQAAPLPVAEGAAKIAG